MNRSLFWSYLTPPLSPWWHPIVDALEPVAELVVLALCVTATPDLMVLLLGVWL